MATKNVTPRSQIEATRRWEERNRLHTRKKNYQRSARLFVRAYADEEDMEELIQIFKNENSNARETRSFKMTEKMMYIVAVDDIDSDVEVFDCKEKAEVAVSRLINLDNKDNVAIYKIKEDDYKKVLAGDTEEWFTDFAIYDERLFDSEEEFDNLCKRDELGLKSLEDTLIDDDCLYLDFKLDDVTIRLRVYDTYLDDVELDHLNLKEEDTLQKLINIAINEKEVANSIRDFK